MKQQIQIISAPSILGLKPTGVEKLPQSLIEVGLINKINSVESIIDIPTLNENYSNHRDPITKCLNAMAIRDFCLSLMKEIANQIHKSTFPLVLGGDCSILIGIMAGLKMNGNYGLIFLDAHADFYQPEKSITGEVADMDLAIVTGRGPKILTDINKLKPYVEDNNIIHIGQRDAEETKEYGSQDIKKTGIKSFDLAKIKSAGINKVLSEIIEYIEKLNLDGYWIHFDTDVISDEENPAVDYRIPNGITFNQIGFIINQLIQTGSIKGMDVTIYNPTLDKDRKIAIKLTDCLAQACGYGLKE
ncbi:MAG: arginase family protein [Ignavibacterium sp.]